MLFIALFIITDPYEPVREYTEDVRNIADTMCVTLSSKILCISPNVMDIYYLLSK